MYDKQRMDLPKRKKGVWAWIKRWILCGIRDERRTMKIYMQLNQLDDMGI